MTRLWFFLLLSAFSVYTYAAPNYIPLQPLNQVINTPVGEVKRKANQLPIITWGGDIATIHGNGNARDTQPNSIFARRGLDYRLVREDVFANQVKSYLSGETPFLRGTMGMLNSAIDVLNKDPRTRPVVFYQMTWSAGGDALVVKDSIRTAADLRGKRIALQAYGPHMDYLARVLKDANLSVKDVTIKWLPDLTGTDDSPASALYENDIDAAFVIIPDALALTSGGAVGTGSEDSVKGARILMSTKTASRVIADVYAVRNDYYEANKDEILSLTQALLDSQRSLQNAVAKRSSNNGLYSDTMKSAAALLLDSPDAIADTEGLYADCEFVGLNGNLEFFTNNNYLRRFDQVHKEIQKAFVDFGLISGTQWLNDSDMNYKLLGSGANTATAPRQRFQSDKVAALVTKKQQQNALGENELFSFEVFFSPNQNVFSTSLYASDFARVAELAATYGGAIITVEGHSDPMGYLRAQKNSSPNVVLSRIKQSARNLSLSRAQSVRDAIIGYAADEGISLDLSQFAMIGHGIAQPNTGVCGQDPCVPKTEQQWRSNMRVQFRIIQIEAESDVFTPL